jgi:hypothetical protein
LKQCEHIGQIQISNTAFGSSDHIHQPESIVNHFTYRTKTSPSEGKHTLYKYFVNGDYTFTSLNVHHATFAQEEYQRTHFVQLTEP